MNESSVHDISSTMQPSRGITPSVRWLIAINVVVYFFQLTLLGTNTVAGWFALATPDFPARWWTVGTYMFVHAGLVHLAVNMFMLWMFGPRVEQLFGTRSFTYFYLWCGLGGAIFHLLFVHNGAVVGASGAVVGVVLAYALRWPEEQLFLFGVIPLRARWLAVWMIVWNVGMALADATGLTQGNLQGGTAWMAHVGGLMFAWIALHAPTSSSLDRIRKHVATIPDGDGTVHPIPKRRRGRSDARSDSLRRGDGRPETADDVVARSNALFQRQSATRDSSPRSSSRSSSRSTTLSARHIDDVNRLLDKISREGIESLSPAERQLLEDISRGL